MENKFIVGVPDSKLKFWLKDKRYLIATDEGEAVAIGAGYYLATNKKASVFMGANGFANALDTITSLLVPYKIPIDLIIALREDVEWHSIMSKLVEPINSLINYDKRTSITYIVG